MDFLNLRDRVSRFPGLFLLVLALLATPISWACKGEPGTTAPFNGVSLWVASPTVPPGGLLQMQISLTEPKPILKGLQGVKFGNVAARAVKAAVAVPFSTPLQLSDRPLQWRQRRGGRHLLLSAQCVM